MEILNPKLKQFLENEEEQKLFGFFHKIILDDANGFILYDTEKQVGTRLEVCINPMGMCLEGKQIHCIVDIKNEPYIRYFEEKMQENQQEEQMSVIFSRYKDFETKEEQMSLAIQKQVEPFQATITSSLHVSKKELLFDVMDLDNGRLYFSTLYLQAKGYTESQKAKMRMILRPLYQVNPRLMKQFEKTNQDLKIIADELLPHREEDIIGAPTLKIYKNSLQFRWER